ncbi:mechanosensitive ion channel-like protein [Chitinophaga skermanii]|uniref:Mechanosensitive ion channel-like protein n=1 Tax=Chitinophaga skermanii TaxID=331697 RepID=A0A327R5U4_9BACT|nr:mechanosensitive ion channel family protein [Chitinophaga skermanii]RAJ10963.1 mechanosensitive ion channel-like protein [Chitinophaga skermanii]
MRMIILISFLIFHLNAPAQQTDSSVVVPSNTLSAPIIFEHDTLFSIQSAPPTITIQERANLINMRISDITARPDFSADSLLLESDSIASRITYRREIVMTITEEDARFTDLDRIGLAESYYNIIKDKTGSIYEFKGYKQLLIFLAETAAVILGLLLFIWGVNYVFRKVLYRVLKKPIYPAFRMGSYTLLSPEKVGKLAREAARFLRWVVIIIAIYFALPVLFNIFPWTKPLAEKLLSFVLNPIKDILRGVVHYIPNLITILIIYFFTRYLVHGVKYMANEVEKGVLKIHGFYPDWAQPTFKIIKALLYILMFVAIFPYLPGYQSKVFQGVSVFLGILISLGSSSAIANVIAGIVITYMRPFKLGERIQIGEVSGDVIEKNMLVTRIRTIKNEEITIPNALILSGQTINYSAAAKENKALILHTTVTIGYDVPWRKVNEMLIRAAKRTEGILSTPEPFVLQTALSDYYPEYQLNAYTHLPAKMAELYSRIHQNIIDVFNEEGIEIMSPQQVAVRDGNTIHMPEEHRPADYEAPSFHVKVQDINKKRE